MCNKILKNLRWRAQVLALTFSAVGKHHWIPPQFTHEKCVQLALAQYYWNIHFLKMSNPQLHNNHRLYVQFRLNKCTSLKYLSWWPERKTFWHSVTKSMLKYILRCKVYTCKMSKSYVRCCDEVKLTLCITEDNK